VIGIRATNGVVAGLVLISFFVLLISFRLPPWLPAILAAALALDPAFLFGFPAGTTRPKAGAAGEVP
jgi:hypothetical protein